MVKATLDELDFQILQLLKKDARLSATRIAQIINANERTIRKRIDRLVDLGAVRLTAIIDPAAFGYINTVDIFLEVEPDKEDEVVQSLMKIPFISYIAFGQGTKDLSIECRFKDNGSMHEFLRKTLPGLPGVKISGYALVPRILRNIDEWMPPADEFEAYEGRE